MFALVIVKATPAEEETDEDSAVTSPGGLAPTGRDLIPLGIVALGLALAGLVALWFDRAPSRDKEVTQHREIEGVRHGRKGEDMHARVALFRKLIGSTVALVILIAAVPASAAVTKLQSALTGGDTEVPDPGDPDGTGAAEVTVNVRKQKLCFLTAVLDITLPAAAAHIHEGEAGVAGDIVVTLEAPVEISDTGIGLSSGCVRNVEKPLLRDIKNNPDQYYVNVHTSDFPGGAVRGQLEAA